MILYDYFLMHGYDLMYILIHMITYVDSCLKAAAEIERMHHMKFISMDACLLLTFFFTHDKWHQGQIACMRPVFHEIFSTVCLSHNFYIHFKSQVPSHFISTNLAFE